MLPLLLVAITIAAGIVIGVVIVGRGATGQPEAAIDKSATGKLGSLPRSLTAREIAMLTPEQRETYQRHVKYWGGRNIMHEREMTREQLEHYIQGVNDRPPESSNAASPDTKHQAPQRDETRTPARPPTPRPAQAADVVPCSRCGATGILGGEEAIKAIAQARAETECAKLEQAKRLIEGQSPSPVQRQNLLRDLLAVHEAQVRLEAKKAEWNGEAFQATCPDCGGTKWRSVNAKKADVDAVGDAALLEELRGLIADLKSGTWSKQQQAADQLAAPFGGWRSAARQNQRVLKAIQEEAVPALIEVLTSQHPKARAAAAQALSQFASIATSAVPALASLLEDGTWEVRLVVVRALIAFGPQAEEACPALVKRVGDEKESMETRKESVRALGATLVARPLVVEALVSALKSREHELERAANEALRLLAEKAPEKKALVPVLAKQLADGEIIFSGGGSYIAQTAFSVLVEVGEPAVPDLQAAAKDGNAILRRNALRALASIKKPLAETVEVLGAALKDKDSEVRRTAAYELAGLGTDAKGALTALIAALDDAAARSHVLKALEKIGPEAEPAVSKLMKFVREGETDWDVLDTLGAIGPGAKKAAPQVIRTLKAGLKKRDNDPFATENLNRFRAIGLRALGRFGPLSEFKSDLLPLLDECLRARGVDAWGLAYHALSVLGNLGSDGTSRLQTVERILNTSSESYGLPDFELLPRSVHERHTEVRTRAVWAIGRIAGSADATGRSLLSRLGNESEEKVRTAIIAELRGLVGSLANPQLKQQIEAAIDKAK